MLCIRLPLSICSSYASSFLFVCLSQELQRQQRAILQRAEAERLRVENERVGKEKEVVSDSQRRRQCFDAKYFFVI